MYKRLIPSFFLITTPLLATDYSELTESQQQTVQCLRNLTQIASFVTTEDQGAILNFAQSILAKYPPNLLTQVSKRQRLEKKDFSAQEKDAWIKFYKSIQADNDTSIHYDPKQKYLSICGGAASLEDVQKILRTPKDYSIEIEGIYFSSLQSSSDMFGLISTLNYIGAGNLKELTIKPMAKNCDLEGKPLMNYQPLVDAIRAHQPQRLVVELYHSDIERVVAFSKTGVPAITFIYDGTTNQNPLDVDWSFLDRDLGSTRSILFKSQFAKGQILTERSMSELLEVKKRHGIF